MSFALWQSTTPGHDNQLDVFTDAGVNVWTEGGEQPFRLVTDPSGGVIVCTSFFTDPFKLDADGNVAWTWARPGGSSLTWDAAPDGNGGAYLLYPWNNETRVYHVDDTGAGTLLTSLTPALLGTAYAQAESLCLSSDGTVLAVLVVDAENEDDISLVGVGTADGSVLWRETITTDVPARWDEVWFLTARFSPGTDKLVVGYSTSAGATVQRWVFGSGVSNAPSLVWTATPSYAGGLLLALAVDTSAVYAGYDADGTNHIISRLDLADGSLAWRHEGANFGAEYAFVEQHGLGVTNGRVLAGVYDSVAFPDEGCGFVLLDAATGAGMTEGVFPLEVFLPGAVSAVGESSAPGPGPVSADPTDRLRSSLSEDLGSLLDAVEVIPVDAGFEIAFTNAVTLEPAVRSNFRELFRATDAVDVDFLFYPRPRQNTVMEDQFDGLTLLSRLDRWFPPRTYGATATFGLGATATAQAVVTYVLAQWATLQPWLTTKPVPDLRMPTRGLKPSEYDASDGLVQTATITIEQDPERPTSALDVLHDLLSPFPGAIVRQDSDGDLVIVPRYGPDADEAPIVTLRTIDLYSVSTGKPDPFATINRATFASSGGLTSTNDVPVMQPAWFQLGPNHRLGNAAGWFTPPVDRTNLQPPRGSSDTLQEDLTFGQFGSQKPILWEASPSVIPAGGGIRLEDSSHDPMITSAYRIFGPAGGLSSSGTGTVTILTATIPFTGAWVDAFKWTADIYFATMRARWVEASRSVEWAIGGNALDGNCWQGCWTCIVEFTVNDSSVAYARGANVTATFGAVGDSLPSATGNAVAESQAALGVIERTVNVSGYELDAATLAAAAEGFVRANITPRMTREIELTVAAQDVTFDRVGRLIELPSGEVGVLVGLTYRDDFTSPPGGWAKTARVQLLDGAAPGAVDDQLDFLTLTDGSILATTAGDPLVLTEV